MFLGDDFQISSSSHIFLWIGCLDPRLSLSLSLSLSHTIFHSLNHTLPLSLPHSFSLFFSLTHTFNFSEVLVDGVLT